MEPKELIEVLAAHERWLASAGEEGVCAKLCQLSINSEIKWAGSDTLRKDATETPTTPQPHPTPIVLLS